MTIIYEKLRDTADGDVILRNTAVHEISKRELVREITDKIEQIDTTIVAMRAERGVQVARRQEIRDIT
jgi:hypothetical protein